ncbi:hypothetical protein [Alicyclobacillus fastidiosus]|uniref:Uncharacterized protein n=1 Tax=Alicyclobacillus fastidiosus TaxID=392011 RepID=A0ABV5A9T9_9BACL|nr:hypothetical protein [Alicyclobacillus fastidiosus]WEH10886.1 hypothetical protein PYS47_06625 [Alicyclobacillus fastidiosus]
MSRDSDERNLRGSKQHLAYMMWQEHLSSEFLLSSVVEDSLLYTLNGRDISKELSTVAKGIAKMSVQTAAEVICLTESTVHELVRGVMSSMLRLGGNPVEITRAVAAGAWYGLREVSKEGGRRRFLHAIRSGISRATEDMAAVAPH